jgi:hypothetical protein
MASQRGRLRQETRIINGTRRTNPAGRFSEFAAGQESRPIAGIQVSGIILFGGVYLEWTGG